MSISPLLSTSSSVNTWSKGVLKKPKCIDGWPTPISLFVLSITVLAIKSSLYNSKLNQFEFRSIKVLANYWD